MSVRGGASCAVGAAAVAAAALLGGVAPARAGAPTTTVGASSLPSITIASPRNGASYERGSRVITRFGCSEGRSMSSITRCTAAVPSGHAINTRSVGDRSFTVTATDTSGNTVTKTVHYTVWTYVNPLRAAADLQASRIDMGVDYSGSGPILALGNAKVVLATDRLAGPEGCWGKTCVPAPGDIVVYRLLNGPFVGKYVYICEHITITVKTGRTVRAGQTIAILHEGSPNLEIGWAAGHGPETLAVERGQQCACSDPGGWSSIEGRNFDRLLTWLGAPSGYLTTVPRGQHMPRGWPGLPVRSP